MKIDDRYLVYLDHPLGQGGYGDVYKGIDTATNTPDRRKNASPVAPICLNMKQSYFAC